MMKRRAISAAAIIGLMVFVASSHAAVFTGTLYYTDFDGVTNVNKVSYSYDTAGAPGAKVTLSGATVITTTPGADGIIFAPDGDLLIGGAGAEGGKVYKVNPTTGLFTSVSPGQASSFHLTLDPSGTKFYSSPFGGELDVVPVFSAGTTHTVVAATPGLDDGGVTQIAFAPLSGGGYKVFYVNGGPNGFGNVGVIDIAGPDPFETTRIVDPDGGGPLLGGFGLESAHGMVFDPFTGKITMFGAGKTGTIDPTTLAIKQSLAPDFNSDFDQGAVDGLGHAFIAGGGAITFIDYSVSGDITLPATTNYVQVLGGFGAIDDVAPLIGAGAPPTPDGTVPEPSSLAMLLGLGSLMGCALRRRKKAA